MKKILLSSVISLTLLVAAATATMAVFTDEDRILGNTISAAHLTLDAREVINKPITITAMLPDEWGDNAVVDLYNDGNVEHYQYMYVEHVVGDLCPYVELKLGYSWNAPGFPYRLDYEYGVYTLAELTGEANKLHVGRSAPVQPNITTRLVQIPHLQLDAPNEVQQDTCTWDEVFVATQIAPTP